MYELTKIKEIESKIKELDIKIYNHLTPPKGLLFNPQLYNELKKQREELIEKLKSLSTFSKKKQHNSGLKKDCHQ